MARKKDGVNKSEEIRQLLRANPKMSTKHVVAALAEKGITVAPGLVYFIKGNMKGRRGRKVKMQAMAATVKATTGSNEVLSTIMRVKSLANDLGGLKKLKALVDALSE